MGNNKFMEAIILVGGLGTRLRSAIGNEIPKCMAPVADKPFLWYLLKHLTKYDINRVVLSVGYLREVIYKWIDDVKDEFPFEIIYAVEDEPLGTGGGIKLALSKCQSNDVVVLNGDTFFDVNLDEFYTLHRLASASVSLALKPMRNFDRYGRVLIDMVNHKVKAFCEKQHCEKGLINGGIYFINRYAMEWPSKEKFSFETVVLKQGVTKGNLYAFDFGGYFIDIGIPSDYKKANEDFKKLF